MKKILYILIIFLVSVSASKSSFANKILKKNNDMIIVETKKHWLGTKREMNRVFDEAIDVGYKHCKRLKKKSYGFYRRSGSSIVQDSDSYAVNDLWNTRIRIFCTNDEKELTNLFEKYNLIYDYYSSLNLAEFKRHKLWAWSFDKLEWVSLDIQKPKITKKNDQTISQEKNKNNEIFSASSGSGFFVTKGGYLISNNHVVDSCNEVRVHYLGKVYKSVVIANDRSNDLSLIKTNITPNKIFYLSNDDVGLMEEIYVSGFPFGKEISSSIKVTKGIVSALVGIGDNYSNIQIDASIQPGSSGGPIVNSKGALIGVAVAKLDYAKIIEKFDTIPEDTNFGIKSSVVKSFLSANNIKFQSLKSKELSNQEIGEMITDGTAYIDCWMTMARIKELQSRKVVFNNIKN